MPSVGSCHSTKMTQETDLERQFQERIARAKEAARLASIAALSRPLSASSDAPVVPPAPPQRPPPPRHLVPPPPHPVVAMPPHAVPEAVRHRIDRLVEFIARNGPAFEDTARERERHNPEFAFLTPGAPFHEYFVWKKSQVTTTTPGLRPPPPTAMGFSAPMPPHVIAGPAPGLPTSLQATQSVRQPQLDPVFSVSVGTMADALRTAKMRGLPAYAPLPPELYTVTSSTDGAPRVEPARLDTRLAEYYRSSSVSP